MATPTSRGAPLTAGGEGNNIPAALNAVSQWASDHAGVSAYTTTQRDALAGDALWAGRVVFNTTTQAFNIWRSDFSQWHEGLESPGTPKDWYSAGLPAGWVKRDGAAYSRITHAALYARIGTTFGAGDGSTTFNVPNSGGRVALGANDSHSLGQTGGSETHTLTAAELPPHTHDAGTLETANTIYAPQQMIPNNYNPYTASDGFNAVSGWAGAAPRQNNIDGSTGSVGSGAAHANMPPFLAAHALIKV